MARKNLKVSEIVHEELGVRKQHDESFDDVLKRELGIIPNTVDDLVTYFPRALGDLATEFAEVLKDEDKYSTIVTESEDHFTLNYDSKDTDRTIMQLRFLYSSEEQKHPLFGVFFRNQRGELKHLVSVTQTGPQELLHVEASFVHPNHGGVIEFGEELSWDEIIAELEEPLRAVQNTAFDRWG